MRAYITEFIGTFFLVLTICMSTGPHGAGNLAPLAIGVSLMVMIYMGGHISGAHYNPAVSLAVFLRGKLKGSDFLPYIVAQLAGAIIAAVIATSINGRPPHIAPNSDVNIWLCLLLEGLYTFALALVILNVATAKQTQGNSFYGLAIGFTVVAAAFAAGGTTGGAFNPAVGIGLVGVEAVNKSEAWAPLWIYILGPLVGGAAAAAVFKEQHPGKSAD
jgi:aquaporin Z